MRNAFLPLLIISVLISSVHAQNNIRVGTTFSKQQCVYLGLDWKETYQEILKLDWDILRLGAYWSEIETEENKFDFEELDWQIQQAKRRGIPVVLTIGMKAPRWPEYFIPTWFGTKSRLSYSEKISNNKALKKYLLRFITNVMERYRDENAINFIQVENEALNKFGGKNWQLSKKFLAQEIQLVSSLDALKRPVILTTATYPNKFLRILANVFTKGSWLKDNLALCDILGINVYPTIGQKTLGIRHYVKSLPAHRSERFDYILKMAHKKDVDVWVMELQAEPWEPGELVHTQKHNPPSISPEAVETYYAELKNAGFKTIFLWGVEYWYYQKKVNTNEQWWDMAKNIINESKIIKPDNNGHQ